MRTRERALADWDARAHAALANWEAALGTEGRATDQAQRFLDVLADESRLFAAHLAQELGTTVTVWLDSADVA